MLGAPTDWAFDASYILYGTLFIMAGAYALSRNAHVRGDFLYRAWQPKTQAWMDLVLYFLFFFPGIIAFIYSGYGFAAQSWFSHEHSAYSPAGPPIYHYKTLIPVTGVFLLLQGIVEVVRCLVCIGPATGRNGCTTSKSSRKSFSNSMPMRRPSHDRPATRRVHARPLRRAHHARLSDRLHADGDGRGLRLARLRRQLGTGRCRCWCSAPGR